MRYSLPVVGVLLYVLFGRGLRNSRMFRVKEIEDRLYYPTKVLDMHLDKSFWNDYHHLVHYNTETSGAVLTSNNQVDILTDGEAKFEDLRRHLAKAKHYIHIQYYIIKRDEVFASLVPILLERAQAGVEIRILYDGMGGRLMPHLQWRKLQEKGIRIGCFFPPVLGRFHLRINYRNHRKIVVIDGETGYVGGFNIGREYLGRDPKYGYWRDTHLRIQGDAVMSLQIRFALDWNYAVRENLFKDSRYFEATKSGNRRDDGVDIQIITSGPDSFTCQIRDNYLELFHKARHHIYIQTPYFIPDDAILSALRIAAQSGVEVCLMIPCKPDHPFVYRATCWYAGKLLASGVKCYTYDKGFLHAKGVMIDGLVSSYGTANMDIRSFQLNFEVNAVIYDEGVTKQLEDIFLNDLKCCSEITTERYQARSRLIQMKEQVSHLLAPFL